MQYTNAQIQNALDMAMKAILKEGDHVAIAFNPVNSVVVKRVNKTGITTESGTKYRFRELYLSGARNQEWRDKAKEILEKGTKNEI